MKLIQQNIVKALFFLFIFTSSVLVQDDWDVEKTVDGIKAYSRLKEGKGYYEFRTVFNAKGTLDQAKSLISNVPNFKNWMPKTLESKFLKKINENEFYGYTIIDTPWPASKRDLVFKATIKKIGNKGFRIVIIGKPDFYPLDKDKVRLQEYNAEWRVIEISTGVLIIDYRASFEPGSSYPNWVIKNTIIDARIETSKNFMKEILKL